MDIKIESIKNYIDKREFKIIVQEIYNLTKHLNNSYPNYKKWFYNKMIKEILSTRNILFVRNKEQKVVGVAFLKCTKEEKKLCTLYVKEEYRNKNITTRLLEESFKYLKTTKPLVTFNENNLIMFQNIINKYDWKLTKIEENRYVKGSREYFYNEKISF